MIWTFSCPSARTRRHKVDFIYSQTGQGAVRHTVKDAVSRHPVDRYQSVPLAFLTPGLSESIIWDQPHHSSRRKCCLWLTDWGDQHKLREEARQNGVEGLSRMMQLLGLMSPNAGPWLDFLELVKIDAGLSWPSALPRTALLQRINWRVIAAVGRLECWSIISLRYYSWTLARKKKPVLLCNMK
jgi:hypothetical protein